MRSSRLALGWCLCSTLLLQAHSAAAEDGGAAVVSWNTERQVIRGFGASSAFFGASISESDADWFFSKDIGIGLSMLRVQIGLPSDVKADGSEPAGATPVATSPELATAKQAIARGAQVWASAWSPPPIWKNTNNKNGSGPNFGGNWLLAAHYQNYADYLADFVQAMAAKGVPLMALSPQNEPDYSATWDGAQWSGNDMMTFIRDNLGPTFAKRGIAASIVAPDSSSWGALSTYGDALFADPTAKGYTGVIAAHPYGGGDPKYPAAQDNGKELWQTEVSQENTAGDTPDPGMTSALNMALMVQDNLTIANVNAWHWWALTISKNNLTDKQRMNPALMQAGVKFKRGYALGNFSKFVRPGFRRIEATANPNGAVSITAFKDATHLVIVAINAGGAQKQTFHVDGATLTSVTPWVTSDAFSLAAQPATVVSGGTFSYTLPDRSVTTFIGNATPIVGGGSGGSGSGGALGSAGASETGGTIGSSGAAGSAGAIASGGTFGSSGATGDAGSIGSGGTLGSSGATNGAGSIESGGTTPSAGASGSAGSGISGNAGSPANGGTSSSSGATSTAGQSWNSLGGAATTTTAGASWNSSGGAATTATAGQSSNASGGTDAIGGGGTNSVATSGGSAIPTTDGVPSDAGQGGASGAAESPGDSGTGGASDPGNDRGDSSVSGSAGHLMANPAVTSAAGSGTAGANGASATDPNAVDTGCSCRIESSTNARKPGMTAHLLLSALGFAVMLGRRRRSGVNRGTPRNFQP